MKNNTVLLLLLLLMLINRGIAQENSVKEVASNVESSSLELPQIQVVPIKDMKTERNYELYIELPEDYAENTNKTYPVLYYTDAMWHLEMLSACQEYILEGVILVGISWQLDINADLKNEVGAHVSRFRDYSISKHSNPEIQKKYQPGQAKTHLDFIRNDVITYIDHTYRTDTNSRTYFGYSLGGEFGAYILLTQPDTFNNYIIGSPTIKDEVDYLSELNTKLGPFKPSNRNSSLNANVFISYGSLEEEKVAEPIEEFIRLLHDRRDNGLSVTKEVIDGSHQTAFPMTVVRSAKWLSSLISHVVSSNTELSFIDIPQLNKAFITTAPEDKKDGLVVGKLGVDGGDKKMILSLAEEIGDHKHGRFDSFLIAHKDKLIFESYYRRGRINLPHPQASATKTYTSMALGRAIQLGYLTMADLDKPIISFLKELDPTKFVEGIEKITLHKALTMRGGLRITKEQREAFEKKSDRLKGQGMVQTLFEQSEPITVEAQNFSYGNFNPSLVMQVIDTVVPGSAKDFIKKELLDKMEITNYGWETDISGLPRSGSRSSMTSRDMMKWGILAINKGKWKGEQLIPEAFIEMATSKIVDQSEEYDDIASGVSGTAYGYFWWQADLSVEGKSYLSKAARGGSGQTIIVIEELDLVVVTTTHRGVDDPVSVTATKVLPSFIK